MKRNIIDRSLNAITMYQLLVYGLSALLAGAVALALVHRLPLSWVAIGISSAVILTVGFIADRAAALTWNAPNNQYSSLITSLILCCIVPPSTHPHQLALAGLVCVAAIVSKYVIAHNHKHLFNPAAVAALVFGVSGLLPATWWIGSPALLPLTIIFGLLVLRKLRRFTLFGSFLTASMLVALVVGIAHQQSVSYVLATLLKSSPLVFLGTIMLTEPTTMPPRQRQRIVYGAIVGALFASQLHTGRLSATPELALIIGNVYAYLVSPKFKLRLRFSEKRQLAPGLFEFSFSGAHNLIFQPGQYLEWTLPQHKSDGRGNRRTFSIASAPGEDVLQIGIRVPKNGSTFKRDLVALQPGDVITAQQLAGDFTLPEDQSAKIVLIAGGIGITPFVSMARTMVKRQQKRDIVLLYFVGHESEYCYQKVWEAAAPLGLRAVPVLSGPEPPTPGWPGLHGRLTADMLTHQVPDFTERRFYISGPPGLVAAYRRVLSNAGIARRHIKTDLFNGY